MRCISKVLAAALVLTLIAPVAGAVTRDGGDRSGADPGQRPRLVRIVKKLVKSLGDLLSDPRP